MLRFSVFAILLFTIACNQDPCATKADFLESFDTFTKGYDKASVEGDTTTYLKFEPRFESLVNDCYKRYKPDMTLEERQDFWKKALKFYVGKFDGQQNVDLAQALDDPLGNYIKDEVMELVKESGFSFITSLQESLEIELPRLMEIFSSEIQKMSDELMKIFQ